MLLPCERRYSALQLRRLPALLMLFALALSPLYLWESGLPQISNIVAAAAVGLGILTHPYLHWKRWWILGLGFVFYAAFVDLIMFAFYGDTNTLFAPLYYIFDFMIFVYLVNIATNVGKTFIKVVFWIHIIQLLFLVLSSLFGVGQYSGSSRFMGFFNNPNQMGNWLLWVAIIASATGKVIYKSWLPGLLATAIASVAIVFTASRSAAIGFIILLGIYIILGVLLLLRIFKGKLKIKVTSMLIAVVLVMVMLFSFIGFSAGFMSVSDVGDNIKSQAEFLMYRFFYERDLDDTWEGRGYDRLWKFPQYLLFGAGEGATQRYADKTMFTGEIHSDWAAILFNYGFIGSFFFFGFLYALIRNMKILWFKLMLLPPFLCGIATYNIRNWSFWVGLAILYACSELLQYETSGEENVCFQERNLSVLEHSFN